MRSLRAILENVPARARNRFLESMSFSRGKLVHVGLGDLRGVLREREIKALVQTLGCKQNSKCNPYSGVCIESYDHACNPDCCTKEPLLELGPALMGIPPRIRQRFLNSLDFENGQLIRADITLVEAHLAKAKMKRLPRLSPEVRRGH